MNGIEKTVRWLSGRLDIKSVVFVLYLSAGAIKGAEPSALPVDLTLLLGGLLAVLTVLELIKKRARVPSVFVHVILLFLFLAWGAVLVNRTDYGLDKTFRLFTLTMLAMFSAVILFRTKQDIAKLINAIVILAVAISIVGLITLRAVDVAYRMTVGSANTITTGLLAGVAIMGLLVWGLEGSMKKFLLAVLGTAICALALVAAGSRGPIFALGLVIIYMFVGFYHKKAVAVRRLSAVLAIIFIVSVLTWNMLPSWSTDRLMKFFSGEVRDTYADSRTDRYKAALPILRNNPQGLGWGGYGVAREMGGDRYYPHNFVLEIGIEAGWGAAFFLIILIATALYRITRITLITGSEQAKMLLALLIFYVASALFSGDINDLRWMLSILALCLASKAIFAKEQELVRPEPLPENTACEPS